MPKEERTEKQKKERRTAEAKPSKDEKPQEHPVPKKEQKRKPNGQFEKGHSKLGGRAPGTKNKNSIRDRLKDQLEPFFDSIGENLLKVQKEEGTAAMMALQEKFMPYFMPKYSSMSIGADLDRPISEEQRLLELDEQYTKKQISINIKSMVVVNNDLPKDNDDPDDDADFDLDKLREAIERNS